MKELWQSTCPRALTPSAAVSMVLLPVIMDVVDSGSGIHDYLFYHNSDLISYPDLAIFQDANEGAAAAVYGLHQAGTDGAN